MSKKIERLVKEQAATWSTVKPPNSAGEEFATGLGDVLRGFEKLRGELAFEDEPSSFEAALQETKERNP
ncbi:MAG: hypothetical protein HQ465_10910 [Rhodospirillales bacterium]|nr:hypothetical protein [Rhodospirillales bacterium]